MSPDTLKLYPFFYKKTGGPVPGHAEALSCTQRYLLRATQGSLRGAAGVKISLGLKGLIPCRVQLRFTRNFPYPPKGRRGFEFHEDGRLQFAQKKKPIHSGFTLKIYCGTDFRECECISSMSGYIYKLILVDDPGHGAPKNLLALLSMIPRTLPGSMAAAFLGLTAGFRCKSDLL
jgi:hypothetical protein